jgi:hypothetical protein
MGDLRTLKDIEKKTTQECAELPIDLQLKADLKAGKIDDRIRRAVAEHKAGRTQPF